MFSNLFSGAIPHELGRLEVLDVSRNNLRGPIPPELGNYVELSILVLSNLYDGSNPRGDKTLVAPSSATY